jgi:hypothetical protein
MNRHHELRDGGYELVIWNIEDLFIKKYFLMRQLFNTV